MDKTTKNILIILGAVLVVCACSVGMVFAVGRWSYLTFARSVDTKTQQDPAQAVRIGAQIADFTVPQGFGSPYGIHIGEISAVGYMSGNEHTHILLTQFPEGTEVNTEKMLEHLNQYIAEPDGGWYAPQTTLIEEKPVTIRGQATTLSISEGTSSEGGIYRSASATFQGRGGPALVLIAGPVEEWDDGMVEEFIASIH